MEECRDMTMLTRAQIAVCAVLALVGALPAQQPLPPEPCTSNAVCVLYTARLLGYIRKDDPSPVNEKFDANMKSAKRNYPSALVVGMGDNLAPEYGSRMRNTQTGQ